MDIDTSIACEFEVGPPPSPRIINNCGAPSVTERRGVPVCQRHADEIDENRDEAHLHWHLLHREDN